MGITNGNKAQGQIAVSDSSRYLSNSFYQHFSKYDWEKIRERIYNCTIHDVRRAMQHAGRGSEQDFMALVSPAAEACLEPMCQLSSQLTRRRFGNIIQMYLPLYLSNECSNICTYCGFSYTNPMPRITLTEQEVLREAEVIRQMGYNHVLLVSGEENRRVNTSYFERMIRLLRPLFSELMLEVQPLSEAEYRRLKMCGVSTVLVYQETYHEQNYPIYHPRGRKKDFRYRLETPDRIGRSGMHRIGLGVLLGLEDWRVDSFFMAVHLRYLQRHYWQSRYSISFPRLRPAAGCQQFGNPVTDRELVQLICAWRLFDQHVELALSTRESPQFRNHAVRLGITAISAGSRTNPGGYATHPKALEQFEIHDDRSPQQVAEMLKDAGLEPVWKDWDKSFH
ncbi:MAG: 2-iminoacetate synthase ThiH [Chitinophagales bacterium]|nr:2-iminoacetate synthase ThiH [Chitinophagales bacterium]MDW8428379.1 2-iminoacetate synthase ThiH [Chitinophagales bacterium]